MKVGVEDSFEGGIEGGIFRSDNGCQQAEDGAEVGGV